MSKSPISYAMEPWPRDQEELGLNDYEYFDRFEHEELVIIAVSHMRRARLETATRKDSAGDE